MMWLEGIKTEIPVNKAAFDYGLNLITVFEKKRKKNCPLIQIARRNQRRKR